MAAAARRFNPIFTATVVPDTIEMLDGAKGPYTLMRGAVVMRDGHDDIIRTVMAFGKPNQTVSHLLQEGRPINLAIQFDRGAVKVVGLPKGSDPMVAAAHEIGESIEETTIKALYGVLAMHDVGRDEAENIIHEILTGESDRISNEGEESPFSPETLEKVGHILLPLVDSGMSIAESLEVTATIIGMADVANYLDQLALARHQAVARAFVAG